MHKINKINKPQNEIKALQLDPNIKTAIIYSLDHLFAYIIQIWESNKSYYLTKGDEIIKYGNLEDARLAAIKENVKKAYLALSNTYEETDETTCHAKNQRFDYSEINL